ncbi:hypothetical protein [uncultured Demequina sp.]|uniref:hypothetical protein n=1 Tax=uncultured Demequina sp. TaxID=693499 RepID=UPI0025F82958|nr:hypothetical protein [uncultured Demequina sp.]
MLRTSWTTNLLAGAVGCLALATAGCSQSGVYVEVLNSCEENYYFAITEVSATSSGRLTEIEPDTSEVLKFTDALPLDVELWVGATDGSVVNGDHVDLADTGAGTEDDPYRVAPSERLCQDLADGIPGEL